VPPALWFPKCRRLVIAAGGAVAQIFAITRLDLVIPLFASLDEALAPRPAAVIRPLRPRPPAGRQRAAARPAGQQDVSW
jgi:hypothetical protein